MALIQNYYDNKSVEIPKINAEYNIVEYSAETTVAENDYDDC